MSGKDPVDAADGGPVRISIARLTPMQSTSTKRKLRNSSTYLFDDERENICGQVKQLQALGFVGVQSHCETKVCLVVGGTSLAMQVPLSLVTL